MAQSTASWNREWVVSDEDAAEVEAMESAEKDAEAMQLFEHLLGNYLDDPEMMTDTDQEPY